jgi:anaphase-promoting complex subunit 6
MAQDSIEAWIAFAHTLAMDDEHEQALSAYSSAARIFTGFDLTCFMLPRHLAHNAI